MTKRSPLSQLDRIARPKQELAEAEQKEAARIQVKRDEALAKVQKLEERLAEVRETADRTIQRFDERIEKLTADRNVAYNDYLALDKQLADANGKTAED